MQSVIDDIVAEYGSAEEDSQLIELCVEATHLSVDDVTEMIVDARTRQILQQ